MAIIRRAGVGPGRYCRGLPLFCSRPASGIPGWTGLGTGCRQPLTTIPLIIPTDYGRGFIALRPFFHCFQAAIPGSHSTTPGNISVSSIIPQLHSAGSLDPAGVIFALLRSFGLFSAGIYRRVCTGVKYGRAVFQRVYLFPFRVLAVLLYVLFYLFIIFGRFVFVCCHFPGGVCRAASGRDRHFGPGLGALGINSATAPGVRIYDFNCPILPQAILIILLSRFIFRRRHQAIGIQASGFIHYSGSILFRRAQWRWQGVAPGAPQAAAAGRHVAGRRAGPFCRAQAGATV